MKITQTALVLENAVERTVEDVVCPCGGTAPSVDTTPEENRLYGCGRSSSCCNRAFVCLVCGSRLVGSAEAPEMDMS
jgi:hypothetical protein